jgi:hypothetical protein
LIALDDQLDDVRGKKGQVDNLHDPPLGEVLACCDLLECLTILDSVKLLMRLGDAADQGGVDRFRMVSSDRELGLDTTLSELERQAEQQSVRVQLIFRDLYCIGYCPWIETDLDCTRPDGSLFDAGQDYIRTSCARLRIQQIEVATDVGHCLGRGIVQEIDREPVAKLGQVCLGDLIFKRRQSPKIPMDCVASGNPRSCSK